MNENPHYQRHYGRWHPDSESHFNAVKNHYKALLGPHLAGVERKAAMDIGCGMGIAMEYLRDEGFNPVYGYDADEGQVQSCRNRGLNAFHSGSIQVISDNFRGTFSTVTALDVLEHLDHGTALETLSRARAMLDDSGVLLCTVPNANSLLGERWRFIDYTHTTSFTEHSLDFLLYSAGFTRITVLPGEVPRTLPSPLRWKRFLNWINFKLTRGVRRLQFMAELGTEGASIPLSINLLAIARK